MALLEGLSLTGLLAAVLLPWLTGALAVALLVPRQLGAAALLGYGFFVGQLLVMALLLLWDSLGATLAFAPMALSLTLLAAALGAAAYRCNRLPVFRPPQLPDWRSPAALACLVLLALLSLRLMVMTQEMAMLPVFAWDAWMNWVPRAIVWFHHQGLTDFVLPSEWLSAPPGKEVYSLGNPRASIYPPGIPLILLWSMLGAGTADHTLLFLPWLLAPLAFSLVLWGHLRSLGPSVLALLTVYLFLSQPLANTHTILVGYADFWLALYFSLAVIAADAAFRLRRESTWGLLLVGMSLAVGCMLLKTPGLVFGALALSILALAAWQLSGRWWARISMLGLAGIVLLLLSGMLPGQFSALDGELLPLPFILPDLRIQPRPLLPILLDSLFVSTNWHLLWVLLPLAAVAAIARRSLAAFERPALVGLVTAAGMLVFVFGFTHYFRQAEKLVTLDRTLLYLVPLATYLIGTWLAAALKPEQADA